MRARRAPLALERERVDVVARRALEGRDHVGADALVRLRVQIAQMQIAGVEHARA